MEEFTRMNRLSYITLLLAGILLACLSGCSERDTVVSVEPDDPEMNAAIAKARETLPQFWETFEKREHGESDFSLKVRITDKRGTEHFWAIDIERRDGKIMGTINNDPDTVRSVKLGDRIEIPEADISDWLYMRDGKMVGNYTLKPLFKGMPAAEVERYKTIMADP
jgi:uncharacterized protein YegJ (DUF2314 family)